MKNLKNKQALSKPHLLLYFLVFALVGGLVLLLTNAAIPNPNLSGDLNVDNKVDVYDLSIVLSHYGTSGTKPWPGDANDDGADNAFDLSIVLTNYTKTYSGTWQATLDNPVPPGTFWTKSLVQQGVGIDSNSANVVSYWLSTWPAGDHGALGLTKWGVAEAMTTGSDPTYSLQGSCEYSCNLNRFGNVPIPAGTQASPDGSGGDFHLSILDKSGKSWDMWHAMWSGSTWTAGCGTAWDLTTDYKSIAGVCGATNGNLPQTALALRPDEIKNGVINHPLAFSSPGGSKSLPNRCPTVDGVGNGGSTNANALVNGMLFRLNPSFNVAASSLSPWEKIIATALQTYGMYFQDNSPNMQMVTVIPINQPASQSWASLDGWTGGYQYFSSAFPWNQMQLMTAPCQ